MIQEGFLLNLLKIAQFYLPAHPHFPTHIKTNLGNLPLRTKPESPLSKRNPVFLAEVREPRPTPV